MLDVLVQLFVCAGGFRSVDVAASNDMALCGIEVEGIRNVIDVAKWEVLKSRNQHSDLSIVDSAALSKGFCAGRGIFGSDSPSC